MEDADAKKPATGKKPPVTPSTVDDEGAKGGEEGEAKTETNPDEAPSASTVKESPKSKDASTSVGSQSFMGQTCLLFVKNVKCKLRGDIYSLIWEITFPIMCLLVIFVLMYLHPDLDYPKQTEPDTVETDVMRGLMSSAKSNPRIIGYAPRYEDKSKVTQPRDRIKAKWHEEMGGLLDLKFEPYETFQDLENAVGDGEVDMDLGLLIDTERVRGVFGKNYTVNFTILTSPGGYFAAPDTADRIIDLWTCRHNKLGSLVPEMPDTCDVNGYFYSGYLALQYLIQSTESETSSNSVPFPKVTIQNYPKPKFIAELPGHLRTIITLLSVLPMVQLINNLLVMIVTEKETRIKEGLRMVGVTDGPYWLAWFLLYAIYVSIISVLFAVLLWVIVLKRVNVIIICILFILFGISSITFAFALTPFFHKPKTAGTLGTLIMQALGLLFMVETFATLSTDAQSAFLSLRVISSLAFTTGLDVLIEKEHEKDGVGFGDLGPGGIAFGYTKSILFIVVDTIIYVFLAIYFDNVLPNELGVRQHPCFCFMCGGSKKANVDKQEEEIADDPNIEKVPASMKGKEAIKIRNVYKTYSSMFGKKKVDAVKNISLDIYENQITAILGRNGAGKSTLFSILIGLLPPTKGKSLVFGLDTSDPNDMNKLRKMTGACLQYEIHFNALTVKEHLEFYAKLRGMSGSALTNEISSILNDLKLTDKADEKVGRLSGGQRRKLSVGLALIGDPKIILLDEPSAGVDPVSRRQLWGLLKKKKEGRVILLTTHFLDEADILADRKAIINNGELKCHGSSLFLKNRFGAGYHVTIETEERLDDGTTDGIVKKHIPSAVDTKRLVGLKEIKYNLPNSEVHAFPSLFQDLEALIAKNKEFKSYGVSMTTLEEVFLMISNEEIDVINDPDAGNERTKKIKFGEDVPDEEDKEEEDFDLKKKRRSSATGDEFNLINDSTQLEVDALSSVGALFIMRYLRIRRNLMSLLFMMFLPTLMVIVGLVIMKSYNVVEKVSPLEFHDPKEIYPDLELRVKYVEPTLEKSKEFMGGLVEFLDGHGFKMEAYDGVYEKLLEGNPSIAALEIREVNEKIDSYNIRINGSVVHGPPILMNAIGSYHLNNPPPDENYTNYFMMRHRTFISTASILDSAAFFAVFLIGPSFTFPAVGMVMELVKDREMDVRNNLRVNGVTFRVYFTPTFIVYSCFSLTVTFVQILILYLFDLHAYANAYALPILTIALVIYSQICLLFSAAFSYLFDTVEAAQTVFVPVSYLSGITVGVIMLILDMDYGSIWSASPNDTILGTHLLFCFLDIFYIPFGIFYWLNKQYTVCSLHHNCHKLRLKDYMGPEIYMMLVIMIIQIPLFYGLVLLADLAKSEGNLLASFAQMMRKKTKKSKKIRAKVAPEPTEEEPVLNPDNPDAPPPEPVESSQSKKKKEKKEKKPAQDMEQAVGTEEEDVYNEKLRVAQLWDIEDEEDISVLLCKDLKKTYRAHGGLANCYRRKKGGHMALTGLNLVVEEGEVFGLLGHNGAGKTTAMRIIIAEERPDSGQVKMSGVLVNSSYSKAFETLGYCAQHDPLWDNITLKEHLEMYAVLRGIPEEKRENLITRLITGLQIDAHADKNVETLSGGTKRKLSYAISMLGTPTIVLLDEPSTGLDPQSKRFLWNTILGSFKVNRGAILTTHSIEEAEVLCTRIGILSKGALLCIGSVQHLKSKYGTGYTLEVKLKSSALKREVAEPEDRFSFVKQNFPEASIDEVFDDKAVFHLPTASIQSISKTFTLLEKMVQQHNIEEYSFSQTTLEQIFLYFAREDEEEGVTTKAEQRLQEQTEEGQKKLKKEMKTDEQQPTQDAA